MNDLITPLSESKQNILQLLYDVQTFNSRRFELLNSLLLPTKSKSTFKAINIIL